MWARAIWLLSAPRACWGPDKILGVSAHNAAEALAAQADGADYLGCGAPL